MENNLLRKLNVNGNIVSSNHHNLFIYFSAIYTQLQVLNKFL